VVSVSARSRPVAPACPVKPGCYARYERTESPNQGASPLPIPPHQGPRLFAPPSIAVVRACQKPQPRRHRSHCRWRASVTRTRTAAESSLDAGPRSPLYFTDGTSMGMSMRSSNGREILDPYRWMIGGVQWRSHTANRSMPSARFRPLTTPLEISSCPAACRRTAPCIPSAPAPSANRTPPLANVRRRQVDRHALPVGRLKSTILDRRLDPFAAPLYRVVRQPRHIELIHRPIQHRLPFRSTGFSLCAQA